MGHRGRLMGSAGHFVTSILMPDVCLGEGSLEPCGVVSIFHLGPVTSPVTPPGPYPMA